ncbi:MAG TPA: methyltransferase domain-containing protein [Longimicrobiales bacterium]|nr:methyltransferase domain-containing protein [Longimicrobiales bacterium]
MATVFPIPAVQASPMITPDLLSRLWCPTCRSSGLRPSGWDGSSQDDGELRCQGCGATYAVRSGIPILVPEAARTEAEWELWREHLRKFQARRETRVRQPRSPLTRVAGKSRPQASFARFTDIRRGAVLDVGCGPGKFRVHFDPNRVSYVGLDPIALPEVRDFPFVQGLAESIPFVEDSFTDVVVLAALDHFRDLGDFLREARRVLRPGGKLHVLQSVHQVRGPISAVKVLGHRVKDALEERRTAAHGREVPKHLAEFTRSSLLERVRREFDLISTGRYTATWYAPDQMFLTLTPRGGLQ